jgi:cellulose synthase/poly-beta-1,6-N-acetylglucosamine synthase-like glycosyltransferase
MTTRILAAVILLASAVIAWLAITFALVARTLQAAISGEEGVRPWVTLVVAARNEAPVIGATVAALAGQDYAADGEVRFDVLVVDDGSTDGTGDLARAAASGLSSVRVVRREPDDGPRMKAAALTFAQA